MPAILSTQSASVQKLFDRIALLPLDQKKRLIARRIISSLKDKECRSLEALLNSDEKLVEKLIVNAVAKYDYLLADDPIGIRRIIEDDAALLSS